LTLTNPSTSGAGKTISITDTTKSSGAGDAPASTTGFYLSKNSTLDSSAVFIGSRAVGPLTAGMTSQGATTVTIPAETATGTYYIIARTDDGNTVVELNESNNTYSRTITIGPDLTISTLTNPSTGFAGQTISITDTTKSSGAGDTPSSTTAFYLSTSSTLDSSAVFIGSRAVGPLTAGMTNQGTTTVAIPAGTAPGTYYIIARADDGNPIVETNENNNTYPRLITVGP
jgi:subtilase family serine protease